MSKCSPRQDKNYSPRLDADFLAPMRSGLQRLLWPLNSPVQLKAQRARLQFELQSLF